MPPRKTTAPAEKAEVKLTPAEQLAADEAALAKRRKELGLDAEPAANTTVIDVDGDGEVVDAESPGSEVLRPEDLWAHGTLEYAGETWEVRTPTPQALSAVALSSGKYVPQQLQNDLVGLFIKQHMSEKSHERLYVRLLDPEDPDFTPSTLGEIMRELAMLGAASTPQT